MPDVEEPLPVARILHGRRAAATLGVSTGEGGRADDPQWALGGDTFVVGAPLPDCAVLPHLNALSPDARDAAIHARPTGIYEPGVGIMNAEFAFGRVGAQSGQRRRRAL